jgi:hypothetical protein
MVRKLIRGKLWLGIPMLSVGALVIGLILNSGIVTILSIVAIVIFAMAIIPYGKSPIGGAGHDPRYVDSGISHGFHDISSGGEGRGDVGPNP